MLSYDVDDQSIFTFTVLGGVGIRTRRLLAVRPYLGLGRRIIESKMGVHYGMNHSSDRCLVRVTVYLLIPVEN